ncbi:helix-turn-helix transcriptional regulator [Bernardetia sp. ABR2-2B]|uniref:helix-turn-helix domain-containing protein n=1 Tax=Bernardetia sp. ABR2-2B TaxID=3127472 RepID=UPI0030D14B4E
MRNKLFQEILDEATPDVEIYVRLYGNIVARVHTLLKQKGMTPKGLADQMGKRPSEIHKWLNGEHNFTLRSIAKLEAELGETILEVPKEKEEVVVIKSIVPNQPNTTFSNQERKEATKTISFGERTLEQVNLEQTRKLQYYGY